MLGRIFKSILHRVSVPKCVSCKRMLSMDDRALCANCLKIYNEEKTRSCSNCSKAMPECSCQNYYLKTHFVSSLSKLVRYTPGSGKKPSSGIIFKMKNKPREDVIGFVADQLTESILNSNPDISPTTVVTNVPNRRSAIRYRGFDHAQVLAVAVAKRLNLEFMPLLVSKAKLPQKSMSGKERIKNARFDLIAEPDIKGRDILLIDDVVTSGASMGNSATVLKSLRPKRIIGATVAIAYKDEKINTL